MIRNPDESFEDYRKRRAHENALLRARVKGAPFFVSKSLPYKDDYGKKCYNTGTYVKGNGDRPVNVKTYKVEK
jgi:hypothetical protein